MKYLKNYSIVYTSLTNGSHVFTFEAGEEFFACFESSELTKGKVEVIVNLEKSTTMLELYFHLRGTLVQDCDRCAEEVELPIDFEQKLIVQFGDENYENTDEIIVLPHNAYEINVAQFIYEYACLALPVRRIHPEGECNEETLKKLDAYKLKNEAENEIDPRWEILKNIKLN